MDEHVLRVHRTSADAITASEVQRTLDENKSVACPPCGKRLPLNELNHHIAKEHCDGNVDSIKVSQEAKSTLFMSLRIWTNPMHREIKSRANILSTHQFAGLN